MNRKWLASLAALYLSLPAAALAAVPQTLAFSARIADNGRPVTGSHTVQFAFWDCDGTDAASCTTPTHVLWTETQTVNATDGVVHAVLGAEQSNALPAGIFNGLPLFLEVTLDGTAFSPRMGVHGAPYAFRAGEADHATASDTAASVAWSGITEKPASFPVADTVPWSGVTGKPASYPPSSHAHPGTDVVSQVASAAAADSVPWTGVSGVPAEFPPSAHAHSGADITSPVASAISANSAASAGSAPWSGITGVPNTVMYPPRFAYSMSGATTFLATTCTNYAGGSVTINAPASGVVVVRASVDVYVTHALNVTDQGYYYIGSTATDCGDFYGIQSIAVPGSVTAGTYRMSVSPTRVFPVAAGSYTYYVNGLVSSGSQAFFYSRMDATFFPN